MSRYIDADDLDDEVMRWFITITGNPKQHTVVNECKNSFRRMIEEQPTADVTSVVHGEWLRHEPNPRIMEEFHEMGIGKGMSINSIYWTCSECGCCGTPSHNFCPNCGAKMDGKKV